MDTLMDGITTWVDRSSLKQQTASLKRVAATSSLSYYP
jgi:hypothetical protein